MPTTIRIPTALRSLTGGDALVTTSGKTVADCLAELEANHPGFAERLFDGEGELRRFVNVFVGDEDIRFQEGLATPVGDGTQLSIVPAVAGG